MIAGTTLIFSKRTESGRDKLNNPVYTNTPISVDNCLIAPITEPVSIREQQAMNQSRDQVRIHLPKAFTGDVSGSSVSWGGKQWRLDSDSTVFMDENTPGDWNRYFRAEFVHA